MYDSDSGATEAYNSASLLQFLTILFKRKNIILTFFISVVAVVTAGSFLMPPVYEASSKLILERELESEKSVLFRMNLSQSLKNEDWLNSEIEIINSYPVAETVVRTTGLHLLETDVVELTDDDETALIEAAVKALQKNLSIDLVKSSNVVTISYQAKDPYLAADVVNLIVETYTQHRTQLSDESEIYSFFKDQIKIVDDQLRDVEQQQANYKINKNVISPDAQRQILMTRLADYERRLTDVRTRRIGKEAKLSVIQKHMADGKGVSIPTTETSDSPSREKYIAKLKGELLDMEIRRERLLQKFTPQYEEVINLAKQIEITEKRILSEIRQIVDMEGASIQALQAEEMVLEASIRGIKQDMRDFSQKEYEYSQISRGLEDNREVYSMLLKQREETRISLAKLEKGIKIKQISPAVPQSKPVKPRKALNIALALFLGLFGGLGLAFLAEYFDHSITTPADLEKYTGIPVLGSIRSSSDIPLYVNVPIPEEEKAEEEI